MNKKAKINAIERDERSIALPIRIPLAKALVGLKSSILEAIASGDFSLIETFCQEKLLPLLEVQSELAYLKGGRRTELSARKVVNESVVEFAPVKLSLGDDGDERARGVIEYLRRVSGLDPSKAKTKFNKHIAGAIGDLSKEITSEVKKAVEDLTLKNVHLRGGKAKILQTLLENGVQVTNTPALAETLFRTQSQQAYAAGRWNTSMDSDIGDYIWGFEYVTAGDDRVREGHRILEGVRLPKEDPFWKKYFPPNGWNCRCTTLEIWKDEPTAKIDFGITGRDPRKRTADAMNVPAEFRGNAGIFETKKNPQKEKKQKKNPEPIPPKKDLQKSKNGTSIPAKSKEEVFKFAGREFKKTPTSIAFEKMYNAVKNARFKNAIFTVEVQITDVSHGIHCTFGRIVECDWRSDTMKYHMASGEVFNDPEDVLESVRQRYKNLIGFSNISFKISSRTMKPNQFERIVAFNEVSSKYKRPEPRFLDVVKDIPYADFSRKITEYIDSMEPLEEPNEDKRTKDEIFLELAEKYGVRIDIDSVETSRYTIQVIENIAKRDTSPRLLSFGMAVKKANATMTASRSGRVEFQKGGTVDELRKSAKMQKKFGWWATESVYGVLIHEDTHQQLYFIETVFSKDEIEKRFQPLIREIDGGKYTADQIMSFSPDKNQAYRKHTSGLLSTYGSVISASKSKYHEMVAEARAEVLAEGKNARDFARRVYTVFLELLKEAEERHKKG